MVCSHKTVIDSLYPNPQFFLDHKFGTNNQQAIFINTYPNNCFCSV